MDHRAALTDPAPGDLITFGIIALVIIVVVGLTLRWALDRQQRIAADKARHPSSRARLVFRCVSCRHRFEVSPVTFWAHTFEPYRCRDCRPERAS